MLLMPLLLLLLLQSLKLVSTKTIHFDEVCNVAGRRIYLELGESGLLTNRNKTYNNASCKRCSLEIITCPSCVLNYKFNFLNDTCCNNGQCCDSCVSTYELPFETMTSSRQFCGCVNKTDFGNQSTKTRSLSILFYFNGERGGGFTLTYSSQRNRQFLINNLTEQVLTTPFFPAFYPTDLSVEYVIDCKFIPNCTITVIFRDFLISSSSLIEFLDWNGQRIFLTTGAILRPPLIKSSGPSLVVKFFANGGTNLGFKAEYSCNTELVVERVVDCGGYIEATGGVITFTRTNKTMYDCYWIIKPPRNYFNWKTHLYLTVTTFNNFKNDSTLTIHKGITSTDEIVETLTPNNKSIDQQQHITSLETGFYIALKGIPEDNSKLVIIYSAFSYKDCYTDANFLCQNHRCISILLQCDGFDHCGDNSDEPLHCKRHLVKTLPGMLRNFYDLRTAASIFVICSLGITFLIFGVIVLLYRINISNQNQRRYQNHAEVVSAILEEGHLRNTDVVEEEIIISDDPPDYEAPPNYEEIFKSQACCSQNSPPPAYVDHCMNANKSGNEKWFQWFDMRDLRKSFKNLKSERNKRHDRLIVSYSDGNLERWFTFNRDIATEENCVIRRSQSIDSFMS